MSEEEGNTKKPRLDQSILRIKAEYRLNEPAIAGSTEVKPDTRGDTRGDSRDNREQKENGHKKRRGQNKAKDRLTIRSDDSVRICFSLAKGDTCDRAQCKFSHDIEAYLASKGPDLSGVCPNLIAFGSCTYGMKCRFLSSHSDFVVEEGKVFGGPTRNCLSRDELKEIRTGKSDLTRAKHFERAWNKLHNQGNVKSKESTRDIVEIVAGGSNGEKEEAGVVLDDVVTADALQSNPIIAKIEKLSSTHGEKLERIELQEKDVRLRSVEKRRLDFRGKSYLAPLTTVGNLPFRRICKNQGVDITCAEMALADNLLSGNQQEWSSMKRHESEDIFGVQITGNHPVSFAKLCDVINQKLEVDFVDINLGCPVEAITNRGAGSALLERKGKLRELVLGASAVLDCALTVKIRTAVRDKVLLAHKLVPQFQEWGVQGITLHGRSRDQRYTKSANWEYIEQCGQLVSREHDNHPFFFGNGDVMSPVEYQQKLLETPNVDGIMIGRGALIKPWIFSEIKTGQLRDISSTERLDILKDFGSFGMTHWGSDTVGIEQTRRFMCEWLSFLHRYVPVGLIEVLPQRINQRPENFKGRDELETLMASPNSLDWIKLSELVLGKAADSFSFIPK